MGSEEHKPSLEAPSLGFRRRRKSPPPPPSDEQPPEPTLVEPPLDPAPPTAEQPFVEQPVGERPVVEQPTVQQPTAEQPDVEQPAVEQPAVEQPATEQPTEPVVLTAAEPTPAADPRPSRKRRARPPRGTLNGHLAAAIAGVVVAAFLVLATVGGLQGCESARGTTSCGGGPGFLLLLLIVVLAVVIGTLVLRWAGVESAGSISFLAVALVSVMSVLFLLDSLEDVVGAVAVGLLTVASYLLSHWVTVRYIDTVE